MPKEKISIDEIVRSSGNTTLQKTSVPLPSDDLSSNRNFYDRVASSTEYHDNKERRKFKELTFLGIVIKCRSVDSFEELVRRTSLVFANDIADKQEQGTIIWEIFIHIPEISGVLPQPSYEDIKKYHAQELSGFEEEKYDRLATRYPKFYCTAKQRPKPLDIWKVNFHDENFLYYGKALEKKKHAGQILADEVSQIISEYQSTLTPEQKAENQKLNSALLSDGMGI